VASPYGGLGPLRLGGGTPKKKKSPTVGFRLPRTKAGPPAPKKKAPTVSTVTTGSTGTSPWSTYLAGQAAARARQRKARGPVVDPLLSAFPGSKGGTPIGGVVSPTKRSPTHTATPSPTGGSVRAAAIKAGYITPAGPSKKKAAPRTTTTTRARPPAGSSPLRTVAVTTGVTPSGTGDVAPKTTKKQKKPKTTKKAGTPAQTTTTTAATTAPVVLKAGDMPLGWGGSGAIMVTPQNRNLFSEDKYEFQTVPGDATHRETIWARPRTELTGIEPEFRGLLTGFDAQTAAQQKQITGVYSQLHDQLAADAASATQRLGNLSQLAGQVGGGVFSSGPTDTAGGTVQGGPVQGTTALSADMASGRQQQQLQQSALAVNTANLAVENAPRLGAQALTALLGQRGIARNTLLGTLLTSSADIRSKSAELALETQKYQGEVDAKKIDQALKAHEDNLKFITTMMTNAANANTAEGRLAYQYWATQYTNETAKYRADKAYAGTVGAATIRAGSTGSGATGTQTALNRAERARQAYIKLKNDFINEAGPALAGAAADPVKGTAAIPPQSPLQLFKVGIARGLLPKDALGVVRGFGVIDPNTGKSTFNNAANFLTFPGGTDVYTQAANPEVQQVYATLAAKYGSAKARAQMIQLLGIDPTPPKGQKIKGSSSLAAAAVGGRSPTHTGHKPIKYRKITS